MAATHKEDGVKVSSEILLMALRKTSTVVTEIEVDDSSVEAILTELLRQEREEREPYCTWAKLVAEKIIELPGYGEKER
jgi:hypothetical protein